MHRTASALAAASALTLSLTTLAWAQSPDPASGAPAADVPEAPSREAGADPEVDTALTDVLRRSDVFRAGDEAVFDEPADDVFGMGDRVAVRAPVDDNAFLMGRMLDITAPVSGDLFVMGETITIDHAVDGDLWAMGADVIIGPEGSVGGDVRGLGRSVVVEGPVGGSVQAGAGRVLIAAMVAGDVEVEVGELVLEPGARIAGDLDYVAPREVENAQDFVTGKVTFTEETDDAVHIDLDLDEEEEQEPSAIASFVNWSSWRLWDYLSKLIVGAVFLVLGGAGATQVARIARTNPAESLGIGFVTLVLLPTASFLCIVTVVPMTLGFLGLMAFGVLLFLGQLVTAQWLGDWILTQVRPEQDYTPLAALAVGLVPVVLAFGLPWIWFLAVLTASLLGMGAIVNAVRRRGALLTA